MKTRRWIDWVSVGLVALTLTGAAWGLAGCVTPNPAGSVVQAGGVLRSNRPRQPAPDEARVPGLVEGNTAFALDLYRVLFTEEENLFTSPHSLSTALAMTYAGARGETEQQMAGALHFTLPQAQLHPAFNALDRTLASRGNETTRLQFVNAIWGQQGYSFREPFLDTLAENYGAGLRVVDFGSPETARQRINQWADEKTAGRVEELLPPGSVGGETALVLVNAATFKAAWMHPFAEARTHDGTFTLVDGQTATVPTMEQTAELGYAEGPGVQAVELPYADGKLSMVILLPDSGAFGAFARGLDAEGLSAILGDVKPTGVRLTMPRFRFSAGFELKDALVELGMVDAFSGNSDFSGMDGTRELFVDQVYHEAFVAVDEAGTEAAAASAVVVDRKGGPAAEREVRVDRPFVFLIRDVETGAVLFLGHVVNPGA